MYFTGFADEAGAELDAQIKATKTLGWSRIETRGLFGKNLALISDAEFETTCSKLAEADVSFNCFGSGIANWSKPINQPPESSYDELRKAIPRMQRLGVKMVRIMSFAVPPELKAASWDYCDEVVKRLQVIVKMAEDAGILCLHENCMNWGGLSLEHTLRLVERVKSPSFKLVFDTGNPVFNDDLRGKPPYKRQSSWEFYKAVRDAIAYVHIKDAKIIDGKPVCTFPGEGEGDVRRILEDLFKRGYDGGISIEPHMVYVFHEKEQDPEKRAAFAYANYIEYGQKLEALVKDVKSKLKR